MNTVVALYLLACVAISAPFLFLAAASFLRFWRDCWSELRDAWTEDV